MSEATNAFQGLYMALKMLNDNLYTLGENLAQTHEKVANIEHILTTSSELTPPAAEQANESGATIKKVKK